MTVCAIDGWPASQQVQMTDRSGQPLPVLCLCDQCADNWRTREDQIGLCGPCGTWGRAFEVSPCGLPFEPVA
ncbi:MAG: hypothetical protein JWN87_1693 [Frankiales bacterium]|nr:hypothetical protein [Frankiales bacterium]MCW2585374.1 hypothetical protein [Frankiales bacterium]